MMAAFFKNLASKLSLRHIPYLLVIPILCFQALALAGCVSNSPSLPNLYIVSFSKKTTSFPELRVGYFGACAGTGTIFTCQSTARSTAASILPAVFPNSKTDTADLTSLLSSALLLQSNVFIPLLAGAALLFLVAIICLVCLKRNVGNPNREMLRMATMACLCLSAALSFTSSLATSETAGALQYSSLMGTGASKIEVTPGMELQVLQWMSFAFTLVFTSSVPWLLRGGGGGDGDDLGEEKV